MENKLNAFMTKKFLNLIFKRNRPFIAGSQSRSFINNKWKAPKRFYKGGLRSATVDSSFIRCFQCNEVGTFGTKCKRSKNKGMAYLVLEAKFEALLKKKSRKAFIAEGKCWVTLTLMKMQKFLILA